MIFNIVEKMDDEFEVSDFPTISAEDRDHDRRLNFMIVENWQRTKSVTRNTLSEKANVQFKNFEQARRPDQLLKLAIERLMTHLLEGMTRPSKIGFELQPPSFDKPFFLPLRPLEQNTASAMAAAIENLLSQSAGGIDIFGGRVRVAMHAVWPLGQTMMVEEEGGGGENDQPGGSCSDLDHTPPRFSTFVKITNPNDTYCLARSVLIGLMHRQSNLTIPAPQQPALLRSLRAAAADPQRLAAAAVQLMQDAGLPLGQQQYSANCLSKIQRYLERRMPGQIRLVLFCRDQAYQILWKGPRAEMNLCLVLYANHYGYILRPSQLFHTNMYCIDCERIVHRRSHPDGCSATCYRCYRFGTGFPCTRPIGQQHIHCQNCNFIFPNADCFDAHLREIDPPPPGLEHDRRAQRQHRSVCAERQCCRDCLGIIHRRFGAHRCPATAAANQQQQQNGEQNMEVEGEEELCQNCHGPHNPTLTPCYIQPRGYFGQLQIGTVIPYEYLANLPPANEASTSNSNLPLPIEQQQQNILAETVRKPIRFGFFDAECSTEGEHQALLVCLDVICEFCLQAGIRIAEQPNTKADGCVCGVSWVPGQRRRWCLPIDFEEIAANVEELANRREEQLAAIQQQQQQNDELAPMDGKNPRRFAFHSFDDDTLRPMGLLLDFLLSSGPKNAFTIVLSHNGGKYDLHLLLAEMHLRGIKPLRLIMTGLKIYQMELGGTHQRRIMFKDSLNFFGCALSALPKTFGLDPNECREKPFFPYKWIARENLDLRLPTCPAIEFYEPNLMKPAERQRFLQWHAMAQQHTQEWCLRDQLMAYCVNDVSVLRAACIVFRNLIGKISDGLDPFMCSSTVAGLAMAIFRRCFLEANRLVHSPEGGFSRHRKASAMSRRYFALLQLLHPQLQIQTAQWSMGEVLAAAVAPNPAALAGRGRRRRNGREAPNPADDNGFRLDGFIYRAVPLRPLVIEFQGCYYHGCRICFPHRQMKLAGGLTAEELYLRTQHRVHQLEEAGFQVRQVWECEFHANLRQNAHLRRLFNTINIPEPLNLREHALFGGRVEPFFLNYECQPNEEILHLDIVSLYPYIMKVKKFPVGLPEVLTRERLLSRMDEEGGGQHQLPWISSAQNPYKGFIFCKILPPTPAVLGDRKALLPYRTSDRRLTFPICCLCAEKQQQQRCQHSNEQRSWVLAYTHTELNAAIDLGYAVTDLFEVWNYQEWASLEEGNPLFAEYMNTFLRIKLEASGWPENCRTQAEKDAYVEEIWQREGIRLDPTRIEFNPGLREVAKKMLVSLWGKFCQRPEKDDVKYSRSPQEFHRLLDDPTSEVVHFLHISEHLDRVIIRKKGPFAKAPQTNCLPLACFVTSEGRLELWHRLEEMRQRGAIPLYTDTDSGIVVWRHGNPHPLPPGRFGAYLGQMKSELEGRRGTRLGSAGKKNWILVHVDKETGQDKKVVQHIRGFELHYEATQLLNAERMFQLIMDHFGPGADLPNADAEGMNVVIRQRRFERNRRAQVTTRIVRKIYRPVYSNGRVMPNSGLQTRPFGWYSAEEIVAENHEAEEEEEGQMEIDELGIMENMDEN